ncbi:hypothetical protein BLGI_4807 [Brevibacillus laterosporus GI-9]|nr:hypothetical protein BLGI_4807 [Brevibacillus laterosporus GI-9]
MQKDFIHRSSNRRFHKVAFTESICWGYGLSYPRMCFFYRDNEEGIVLVVGINKNTIIFATFL